LGDFWFKYPLKTYLNIILKDGVTVTIKMVFVDVAFLLTDVIQERRNEPL
jgi:hypothetical protein